jgi:3-oxoacyl-[acyl-carrier-protein] synthase II
MVRAAQALLPSLIPHSIKTKFACEVKGFTATDFLDKGRCTQNRSLYTICARSSRAGHQGLPVWIFLPWTPSDTGVIWGSGQGGMQTFEDQVKEYAENDYNPRFSPYFCPKIIVNIAAGLISMKYGLMGINYATVSACATSNTAIMDAFNYIRWGKAKVMITGGSEAPITEASIGGFSSMRALSTRNDEPTAAFPSF